MSATTRLESTPPESSAPSGTSLMRCERTEASRRASTSASASSSDGSRRGSNAGCHQRRERLAAALERQRVAGRQLVDAFEQRAGRGAVAKREVLDHALGARPALDAREREQRLDLGRERPGGAAARPVERLDADAVARHEEPSPRRGPRARTRTCRRAGARSRRPTARTRARSSRCRSACGSGARSASSSRRRAGVVVDLAVVGDPHAPVLVADRLVARVHVDGGVWRSPTTARSTTTRPCAASSSGGAPLPHAVRHRDDRARLRAVGRRLRAPARRHVRVRDLGPAAATVLRPRPPRCQAALLDAQRRRRWAFASRSRRCLRSRASSAGRAPKAWSSTSRVATAPRPARFEGTPQAAARHSLVIEGDAETLRRCWQPAFELRPVRDERWPSRRAPGGLGAPAPHQRSPAGAASRAASTRAASWRSCSAHPR